MSSDEFLPTSAAALLASAVAQASLRCLPGHSPPPYPVPLRCGVPLPKGKLTGEEPAWLIGPNAETVPAQSEVLSRWPDGSARWVLLDVSLTVQGEAPATWRAVFVPHDASRPSSSDGGRITRNRPDLELRERIELETGDGERLRVPIAVPSVEGCGLVRGEFEHRETVPHHPSLSLEFRRSYYPFGLIRMEIVLENRRRARHRGGLWDLGDAGSFLIRRLSYVCEATTASADRIERQLQPGGEWTACSPPLAIDQYSSGGDQWQSINHVDRDGRVPWRERGYRIRSSSGEATGLRATPSIRLLGSHRSVVATMPHFWEQFPKSIRVSETGIEFGLFPAWDDERYELQGGERKTHTIWLKIDSPAADLDAADLSWVHDPPRLVPVLEGEPLVPGWPRLDHLDAAPLSKLNSLCDEALTGPASVFVRREQIDEYGWRNFGDFFADHETVYYKGPPPLISHYNNQYDVLGGLLLQGLRTEDPRWFRLAEPLLRHVTDIDLYHTAEDRAVFNGGLFWLTDHYSSCGTATHRCFSKLNAKPGQPYGGGPGCEHNYSTGLLACHWLTGDPEARDAVIQLAEWVLAMDDGRRTIFGLIDDGPTGLATATAEDDYHGPGRGAGNSINSLLDAWLLTGERTYLENAERLLHRCIHPADDVAARNLLHFELRWSYTVFLMAVMKYLECKGEIEEFDADFEYARQSLLHYASWMLDHERPYFDRPEQMEFPTETWGAQELRKANAFRWAARWADEPLRSRLQQTGNAFAERAWHDLCRFPTRTFIRPVTLAMIQGLWDAELRIDKPHRFGPPSPQGSDKAAAASWGEPAVFLPQKTRVKRMLASPRGLATALVRAWNPRRWVAFAEALWRTL